MIAIWMLWIMVSGCAFASLEIQTQYGVIEGTTIGLPNGKRVDAFLGVPYAAPPVGRLRFAPPQPPESWNGTRQTKTVSKSCVQVVKDELKPIVWFLAQEPESEDCLYLNVWRPSESGAQYLPVMIWIHGGGYIAGSASTPLYNGGILATQNDVIVVSMNYRLDLFGFLYMNSSRVAENVGLQDQILAIEWVSRNIRNLGGDPKRITLFGQSMGAVSVGCHAVNPQVSELFRYAILESGTVDYELAYQAPEVAHERSLAVAEKAGCLNEDVQVTMACLRNQSVENLVKGNGILYRFASSSLGPVRNGVQVPLDSRSAFQSLPPAKRKNLIVGNVPREMGYLITCFLPQEQLTVDINVTDADVTTLIADLFQLSDARLQSVVLHEYRNLDVVFNDPDRLKLEIADMLGDAYFTCPGIGLAQSQARSGPNRAYYYHFTHKPSKPIRLRTPEWMGVIHGDELPFVFGAPLDPDNGYTEDEVALSKMIMTFWTNFAKTGNPNGEWAEEETWPPAANSSGGPFEYLVLDTPTRVGTKLKESQCNFWSDVYPQLASLQLQLQVDSSSVQRTPA